MSNAAEKLATLNASAAAQTRTHRIRFLVGSAKAESKAPESLAVGCMSGTEGSDVSGTVGSHPLERNPA